LAAPTMFTSEAKAEIMVPYLAQGMCLDVNESNNKVSLYQCQRSANQTFFTADYGQQRFKGKCLDQENASQGAQLVMATCANNKPSQRWSLVSSGPARGAFRNEAGWCADVFRGNVVSGEKVIAWTCGDGKNQRWGRARPLTVEQVAALTGIPVNQLSMTASGQIISGNSGAIISGGAGNIISGGAGNIISGGAGNFTQFTGGLFVGGPSN
jgi:hypothetical protein